jgi:Mg2+/Co2+ transporter CorB
MVFFVDPASCIFYVLFLLLSSYFAATETAYAAVSKVRMRTLADKGNKRAKRALWVCDRFDKTLTTILVGNNIVNNSIASLSSLLFLSQFSDTFGDAAVLYGTIITTLIVYLFGEVIPKSLAKARPEGMALAYAGSMVLLVRVLTPITALFSVILQSIMNAFIVPFHSSSRIVATS